MASSGMPWIKLYNEFLDDPKVGRLTPGQQLLFVKLLLVAGECDAEGLLSNGDDPLTFDDIAWRLRFDADLLAKHWQALELAGLVETQEDGSLLIIKFAERQDRPQSDKRALWRARQQVKRRGLRPVVFERDKGKCGYCGKQLSEDSYVLDHIIPPDQGGSSELNNLTTCCSSCNTKKGGRTPGDAGMPLLKSHSVSGNTVTDVSQTCHSPRVEESRVEESRSRVEVEQNDDDFEFRKLGSAWANARGGLVNPLDSEELHTLRAEYTYQWVYDAIIEANNARNRGRNISMNFVKAILSRWHQEGKDAPYDHQAKVTQADHEERAERTQRELAAWEASCQPGGG